VILSAIVTNTHLDLGNDSLRRTHVPTAGVTA
jgi:hypothetical protein